MYENGKMRPFETIPGIRWGGEKRRIKENEWWRGEFNYDIL
jgi:hypothetical protein